MSWQDVQDALTAAVAQASELDPTRIVWAYQDVDAPPTPYIRMAMPTILQLGQDFQWLTFDASRPAGQEFEVRVQGQRELPIELQCFTDETADGNAANFLLEQTKTNMVLPTIRRILTAQGLSLFDPGNVDYVPQIVAAGFRGRATCTWRCYAPARSLAEYCGYIATVNGTIKTTGGASGDTPVLTPYTAKVG